MPRMSPQEAGRKGGRSRSEKKLAAAKRNGFQKTEQQPAPASAPEPFVTTRVLVVPQKERS